MISRNHNQSSLTIVHHLLLELIAETAKTLSMPNSAK